MNWTCPYCGSRTYRYDSTSIQNKCSGCGRPVDEQQQAQARMQYDRTLANARDHLRAGNWNQTVSLVAPMARDHPADVQLHRLILQAATREFRDYEMNDSGLRSAASDAWDRLARLNGLTGEMLRYSQTCYAKRREKLEAIRNKFLMYIVIAAVLFLYMGANMATCGEGLFLLLAAGLFWALYRAVKMHPSGALRDLRAAPPAWSANPFHWRMP